MKFLYKIEILNWEKFNKKSRPSMPYIMLSKRFFDDSKIQSLPSGGKLLWLGLLLRRGDVDSTSFEASHEDLVRFAGGSGNVVSRLLDQLQSFQLLKYEKTTLKLSEVKLSEVKLSEIKVSTKYEKPKTQPPTRTAEIIAIYCDCWKASYRTTSNPTIGPKEAGMFKKFLNEHGFEKAEGLVRAYLKMPDKWFITKRHDVPTMMASLNAIILFMDKGQTITQQELQNLERTQYTANLIRDIEENGI